MKKLVSLATACILVAAAGNALAAGSAAAGKAKSGSCAACHGVDGNSGAPNFPRLAGLDAGYIAKQLADFKAGARKDPMMSGMAMPLSKKDMAARRIVNTHEFSRGNEGHDFTEALTDPERLALIEYMKTL